MLDPCEILHDLNPKFLSWIAVARALSCVGRKLLLVITRLLDHVLVLSCATDGKYCLWCWPPMAGGRRPPGPGDSTWGHLGRTLRNKTLRD